jgi:hypothetical protein
VKRHHHGEEVKLGAAKPFRKGPYFTVTTVTVVTPLLFESVLRDGSPTPTLNDRHTIVTVRRLVLQTFLVGVIAVAVVMVFRGCFLCVRLFLALLRGKG